MTFAYSGLLSKKMPGTVGSLAAFAVLFCFLFNTKQLLILFLCCMILGIFCCYLYVVIYNKKENLDPKYIVIDEVCGVILGNFLISFFNYLCVKNMIINLILFRIFDIFKPFGIKKIEQILSKKTPATGIMLDDILAAITAFFMQIIINKLNIV